jgi:peptidoglycan/xylan/chitin deacetylase (PgdA/CDA1 family)
MERSGVMETHSHTHSHTRWDRQSPDPRTRLAALEEDLARSRTALREHLGRDSRHLCWPFGHYQDGFGETAERAGFSVRYSVHPGVCRPGMDLGCLPRVGVTDVDTRVFAWRIWIYSRPWINTLIRVRDRYAPSLRLSRPQAG